MAQALYLKWRPQVWDDVVGQEHVTRTLRNAIAADRVHHAYLFAGPRGCGKTTTARLVAKAVNCLHPDPRERPCNTCARCLAVNDGRYLDLIEIDGASNNSVDDVRNLRDKINFAPNEGRYKVYVVDECFRYEDLITLADGSKQPIGKIVESGWHAEVLSYNEQTGEIEPRPIVRHMRKAPALPTVRITLDNNCALVCTTNHKFYTPQGLRRAGELQMGQFVYAGYERITQHQLEVVAGAAIGDRRSSGLAVSVVRKIERVLPPDFVYNIEVADNHNYFARDILVANCHMLSGGAFNALLKTLEEPPAHALFILATTEVHKIPDTVLSRCQRHEFRLIPQAELVARLKAKAAEEGLPVEDAALQVIARHATGSLRDAISLLDQLAAGDDEVTLARAQDLLGAAAGQAVQDLLEAVAERDTARGLTVINRTLDSGADPRQFARQVVDYVRGLLLARMGNLALVEATEDVRAVMERQAALFSVGDLLRTARAFNVAVADLRTGWQPQLPLELAVVEITLGEADALPQEAIPRPRPLAAPGSLPTAGPPPRVGARSAPRPASPGPELLPTPESVPARESFV